jgi:hypothetical protein
MEWNWIYLHSQWYNCPSCSPFEVNSPPMLLACQIIASQSTEIWRTTSSTNADCNTTIRLKQASPNQQTILHKVLFSHLSLPRSLVEQSITRNKIFIHTWIEPGRMCPSQICNDGGKCVRKNKEKNWRARILCFYNPLFAHIFNMWSA